MSTTTQPTTDPRITLPSWFSPELYNLTLHPTLVDPSEKFRFEGKLVLTAMVKEETHKHVTLHSKELALGVVGAWENPNDTDKNPNECVGFSFNMTESTCTFEFKRALPIGRGSFTIEFVGTHNNQMAGFYRSGYTNVKGERKMMVSTQFEALDARRCFPCVDEPAAKAVFETTLVVDNEYTALSNMPEASITHLSTGKKIVTFLPSPKMSTYLLAFAVGEFDFVQARTSHGVLVRVFTPPGKSQQGTFALGVAVKCLDLYDDYFAIPYPLPKLDMIAIPEFAMGAMENWGLVTYREVEVLITADASADQKQRVCTVITHELAHQWFGNLVTMAWWRGLWLNEGFASWMQTFAANEIFPAWSMWSQFVVDDQATALSLDALASSHPVDVPIKHAEEVEEIFDAVSYHKGACVVQLAHAYLGPKAFREGLQLYMSTHAYGNTETTDLWKSWEKVSGKPVGAVLGSWTDQLGYPVLTVSKMTVANGSFTFKVKQNWFLADGSQPDGYKTKSWKIPLFASFGANAESGGSEVVADGVDVGMLEGLEEKQFTIKADGCSDASKCWLKLNSGQHVPVRVHYTDAQDVSKLANAVKKREMNAMDRAGLVLDSYALCKAGLADPGSLLVLLSAFVNEDNMAVWDALEQTLNGLSTLLRGTPLEAKFFAFARNLIAKRANELGWEPKPQDSHLDTLSRAILVRLQAKFMSDDNSVKTRARTLFNGYIADPIGSNVPADLKLPVFRVALSHGTTKDKDAFVATLDTLETVAQKKDVYGAVGFTPLPADKTAVLDWCTSGAIKLQDFFYPIASVSGSGAVGGELAFQYMLTHFHRMHAMVKTASPSLIMAVISYCCSGFASVKRATEIEEFFEKNPVPLAARKVAQIVENTKANAAFLKRMESSALFAEMLKV